MRTITRSKTSPQYITKTGFTLIEVILVLAVGSLIFAMAFIAYGQASINRRDTQRRADLGKIASELENYAADNNGQYPIYQEASWNDFKTNYLPGLKDPAGLVYLEAINGMNWFYKTPAAVHYDPENFFGLKDMTMCDGSVIKSKRDYVIRMKLEKGEACRDSSN